MSIKAGKVVTNLDRTTQVLKLIDARELWAMQQRRPMSRQPYESTADALPLEGLIQ